MCTMWTTRLFVVVGVVLLVALHVGSIDDPDESQPPLFDYKRKMRHSIESHAQSFGYTVTRYYIRTQDGYYLLYHRLTKGKTNQSYLPVLLQHGVLNSSASFMAFRFSLAYLLVDQGFDVWMGNARGNMYSRKHENYNPNKNDKYWEFSFHEMGKYDIPAGIDYILSKTKKDQLYYVGFSMGTTMYFVMGATRPEYMAKVKAMIAMAPVVRPKNMALAKNKATFYFVRKLFRFLTFVGFDELFPYSRRLAHYTEIFCNPVPNPSRLCKKLLRLILDDDSPHFDDSMILSTLLYVPAGTSVLTVDHYFQMAHAGKFQQYDFGRRKNVKRYGTKTPPEYDLKKVTSPVYLVWGKKDTLSVEEDIHWLMDQLPTRPRLITTTCSDYCHRDFMYGKNAEELLNRLIVKNIHEDTLLTNTRVEETKDNLRLTSSA